MPLSPQPEATRADDGAAKELTEQDLLLGKKTVRIMKIVILAAVFVCAALTVVVFLSVPWTTRLPYSGQFGRNGIPMPIAMLVAFVPLLGLWRSTKKPDAHHLGKGARVRVPIFGTALILVFVWAQWTMAHGLLVEGGALPG